MNLIFAYSLAISFFINLFAIVGFSNIVSSFQVPKFYKIDLTSQVFNISSAAPSAPVKRTEKKVEYKDVVPETGSLVEEEVAITHKEAIIEPKFAIAGDTFEMKREARTIDDNFSSKGLPIKDALKEQKKIQSKKVGDKDLDALIKEEQDISHIVRTYMEGAGLRWKVEPIIVYPLEAEKQGLEGVVVLLVSVNRDGSIRQVIIEEKSGHPMLDENAIKSIYSGSVGFNKLPRDGKIRVRVPYILSR